MQNIVAMKNPAELFFQAPEVGTKLLRQLRAA